MINKDRVVKLLKDLKEWKIECEDCIDELKNPHDEKIKKMLYHSMRAYFLDFHILCEDFISITLKKFNKYTINISAIEGMNIIKDLDIVSNEFLTFYITSRRLRNRLAHRYKLPSDEELLATIANNINFIEELEQSIRGLLK